MENFILLQIQSDICRHLFVFLTSLCASPWMPSYISEELHLLYVRQGIRVVTNCFLAHTNEEKTAVGGNR